MPPHHLPAHGKRHALPLKRDVIFADDCVGDGVKKQAHDLKAGQVLLLENLRYHTGEEKNDEGFARQLAALCDIYVNDAFATAHRAQASTHGVAKFAPVGVPVPTQVPSSKIESVA